MRKLRTILVFINILVLAGSCDVEHPKRYFDANNKRSDLNYAYMDTWDVSGDLTSRWFAVSFRSEPENPQDFITFLIGSYTNETDILANGVYDYDYLGGRGFISDLIIGQDLAYDYLGYPTGWRLDDNVADFSGTITVERERGNEYKFIFDLQADYNNETYTITGEYNGSMTLNTGVVDISSY